MASVRDTNTGKTIKNRGRVRRFFSKLYRGSRKVLRVVAGRTIPQRLFRLYISIVIVGALLLSAPFCLNEVKIGDQWVQANGFTNSTGDYGFIQALFIACSGFSDTGLTPISVYQYFNYGGQVVLMILIEIGGIGVITMFYFIWNFFKKKDDKIDVGQLYIMQAERGGSKLSQSYRVIKTALIFILITQFVFMIAYAFCFCYIPSYEQAFLDLEQQTVAFTGISFNTTTPTPMYHNFGQSMWVALFTTVSAMNNAGFDNISATSLAPFRNDIGILLQTLIVIELIIGGLGHFVWFDIIEKIRCKSLGVTYKMTLYTKVAITVYILVAIAGVAGAIGTEFMNPYAQSNIPIGMYKGKEILMRDITIVGNQNQFGEFGSNPEANKIFAIIFHSFNSRSLGMETVKTSVLFEGTKWLISILMFIGASPSSTAGGIRTTTLAVIIITIWCKLCGRKNVFFFKRRISQDTVTQAFMIFVISLILVLLGTLILWTATPMPDSIRQSDPHLWFSYVDFFVECSSAYGTVGLSTGVTARTAWWGLLYLVILMFVGQLGVINTLLSWTRFHPRFSDIEYPYEYIKIG